MITVAIVSPKISLDIINKVIENHDFGCEFKKYVYGNLTDIIDIYADCKDDCDVIFFSGELGYHFILNNIKDIKLPCSFIFYETKHILLILLDFVIRNPTIPLNRVLVDFLTPLNNYMELKTYLSPDYMPFFYENAQVYDYEHVLEETKALWDADKIDIVLTRTINNMQALEKLNIPHIPIFPTESMVKESIQNALDAIKLKQKASAFNGVILLKLVIPDDCKANDVEYSSVTMYKLIVDYRKERYLNFSISKNGERFEISYQCDNISDELLNIKNFLIYLVQNTNVDFRIGTGVSTSVENAQFYAQSALLESIKYGKNDGFAVCGQDSVLIGPLLMSVDSKFSYTNKNAISYAQSNGINESNLLKILGVFETDNNLTLSSPFLSEWLNITPRSCNRILLQLLSSQFIREVQDDVQRGKGRPTKYYKFNIKNIQTHLM